MSEITEQKIVEFIADFWGADLQRLNNDDVFGSLGIDGDDAFEFMEKFAQAFNITLDDYRWYFHNQEEGINFASLLSKAPYERVERIPISIGLLLDSANAGRWTLTYAAHELPKRRYDIYITRLFVSVFILSLLIWLGLKLF